MSINGSCLCGHCGYETASEPLNVRACHCQNCQRATGAPFYARVLVPLDEVDMSGPIGWYHSSPEVRRGFCKDCGTTLFSERASLNAVGLSIGSIHEPGRFRPTMHIWTRNKQPWVEIEQGIPRYEEGAPA